MVVNIKGIALNFIVKILVCIMFIGLVGCSSNPVSGYSTNNTLTYKNGELVCYIVGSTVFLLTISEDMYIGDKTGTAINTQSNEIMVITPEWIVDLSFCEDML